MALDGLNVCTRICYVIPKGIGTHYVQHSLCAVLLCATVLYSVSTAYCTVIFLPHSLWWSLRVVFEKELN